MSIDDDVLRALFDGDHVDHSRAWSWAERGLPAGWASCALTENGVVRILSQPPYPSPVSPHEAVGLLRGARAGSDHEFWECDLSLVDSPTVDSTRLHGSRQITDAYLVALAASRNGHLVTFGRRISLDAVPAATEANLVVL